MVGLIACRSEAEPSTSFEPDLTTTAPDRTDPEGERATLARQALVNDLEQLVTSLPPASCLAVVGPDVAFAHQADLPLVPASTLKLLTATAALEVLGEEPPVLDLVERAVRDSDNAAAEALLRDVGGGTSVEAELGDLGPFRVADATGHSRDNRMTCQLLVDLLVREGTGDLVRERLAVAGQSGTLADRFVGTDLVGVLRAKTGSLSSVAALAGVVEDDDPPLVFALVINAEAGSSLPTDVEALQQRFGEVLASWPEVSDG